MDTTTLSDLSNILDGYLNATSVVDYCPNGVQVEGRSEIRKIATAVSANSRTIEQAVKDNVDALIVHHGLFWKGEPYPIKGRLRVKLKLLLENGISLLAYHLPLDAHREVGNNWRAAIELGWENLLPFGLSNGLHIGVKGTFPPMPVAAFMAELEAYYSHNAVYALEGKKIVSSASLVSGGSYRMLSDAVTDRVDCFITGNFDEPAWNVACEEKINFFALGHSATERVGPQALASYIEDRFRVPTHFIDTYNPF